MADRRALNLFEPFVFVHFFTATCTGAARLSGTPDAPWLGTLSLPSNTASGVRIEVKQQHNLMLDFVGLALHTKGDYRVTIYHVTGVNAASQISTWDLSLKTDAVSTFMYGAENVMLSAGETCVPCQCVLTYFGASSSVCERERFA